MIMWFVVVMMAVQELASAGSAPPGSCPPMCVCKWKYGKQTVECVDRALITVPDLVDPATQVLDLTGNNLQILPPEAFARTGLLNLQRVYLKNCKIGQIDDRAFKGLTNLVELDLSHNLLTHIPSRSFEDVPFLRDLSLSYNPVQKIHGDALGTLKNLVKLDLSKCDIRNVAQDAFKNARFLESLKLNGNELREWPTGSLESAYKLRVLELSDNPWACDCRLRELQIWLTERKLQSTPRCATPSRLADRAFSELNIDEFACKPEILHIRRFIEVSTGNNATIVCQTEAIPSASIHWYLNGRQLLNNTNFGTHQKVFIYEDGYPSKRSVLTITNVQESDTGDFYCMAENKGGKSEANFTLIVTLKAAGMASLGSAQIASLSAALLLVIIVISLAVIAMFVRLRTSSVSESKTPRSLDCVVTGNGVHPIQSDKPSVPVVADRTESAYSADAKCNPVQKPPRINEIPYTTNHYDGRGSIVATAPVVVSPTISGNDPDIINDTRPDSVIRPGSGDYAREASDSLYPSGLWEQGSLTRAISSALPAFYSDKTPIMESCSAEGSQEELGYASRTFPRAQGGWSVGHDHPPYPADYGLPVTNGVQGARTVRVWQRAPPVLPPVSALKRVLTNRNSPDEGYQEGCGTDV